MITPELIAGHDTRPAEQITVRIPADLIDTLRQVAAIYDLPSYNALIQLYINQGLQMDLDKRFYDYALTTTAAVLARHLPAADVAALMDEVRTQVTEE